MLVGMLGATVWVGVMLTVGRSLGWIAWLVGGLLALGLGLTTAWRIEGARRSTRRFAAGSTPGSMGGERDALRFAEMFQSAVRRTMVGMMLADGVINEWEPATISTIHGRLLSTEFPAAELEEEVTRARSDGRSVVEVLSEIAPVLDSDGTLIVMRAAVAVAMADGSLDDRERGLLEVIASTLNAPPGLLEELTAEIPNS